MKQRTVIHTLIIDCQDTAEFPFWHENEESWFTWQNSEKFAWHLRVCLKLQPKKSYHGLQSLTSCQELFLDFFLLSNSRQATVNVLSLFFSRRPIQLFILRIAILTCAIPLLRKSENPPDHNYWRQTGFDWLIDLAYNLIFNFLPRGKSFSWIFDWFVRH